MGTVFTSETLSDANAIDPIEMQYTEEKRDSKTALSIASNETGKCEKQGKWSGLPSLPLEKIYYFLRREDQVNMSLVCRNWSQGYGLPSVWKTFIFDLTESQLLMDKCPVMKFVQKYNSMFRHVEIWGPHVHNNVLMKNFCRHVVEFLQILTRNTQLISVEFRYFSTYFRRIDIPTYNDIFRAVADFLASQHHLKRVEFDLCPFGYQESVELLRNLIENNRESLTYLKLERFLRYENKDIEQDSNAAQKLPTLSELPNLTTLEIYYSLIFEYMVARLLNDYQTIKSCQTRKLSKIILTFHDGPMEIDDFTGLTSTDWRLLKILCPDLQVDLSIIIDSATRRKIEFFIVPNMPITRLAYFCEEMETDVLFGHLLACKTNDHLVTLHLDWEEPNHNLSSTFIPFLQSCKKLKCLEIFICYPTSGIDVLLESWLENRPESLEKVIIDVSYVRNENDFPGLSNITEYVSLLKLAGLNIRVDMKVYS